MMKNLTTCLSLLFLFSCFTAHAQWQPVSVPVAEPVFHVVNSDGVWIIQTQSGCYRSLNDGLSWEKSHETGPYLNAAIGADGNDVYLVSRSLGLLKTSDQGQTWQTLSPDTLAKYDIADLAFTGSHIFYSTPDAVYRYDKANPGMPVSVFSISTQNYNYPLFLRTSGQDVWVSVNDSLLKSTDQGQSWSLVHQGYIANGLGVRGDTILVGTKYSVYRSVDGGTTWQTAFTDPYNINRVYWETGHWVIETGLYSADSYQVSTDGGASWSPFAPSLASQNFYGFTWHNNTQLGFGSDGVIRSTDSGNNWEAWAGGLGGSSGWNPSSSLSKWGKFLTYDKFVSNDQGATWFGTIANLPFFNAVAVHQEQYYEVDLNNTVYRSDSTLHHLASVGQFDFMAYHEQLVSTGDRLFDIENSSIDAPGVINETTNSGVTWTPTGGTVIDSNYIIVGQHGYIFVSTYSGRLYRSSNGGVTWQNMGLIVPSGFANMQSSNGVLFLYGYDGIFVSLDDGLTFTKKSNHLVNAGNDPMEPSALVYDGNWLAVATNDGIFVSPGLSDAWYNITDNLDNPFFFIDAILEIQNGWLFFSGDYRVFKRDLSVLQLITCSGKVWHDDNNNGVQDPGELPYASVVIQYGPNEFTTTQADGTYELLASHLNDTLRVVKPFFWAGVNPSFYIPSTTTTGLDFGIYLPPNITDLKADLTVSTIFKPGFQQQVVLNYTNAGTAVSDGILKFVANAPVTLVGAVPIPSGQIGDTLYWNITGLAAMTGGQVILTTAVADTVPLNVPITLFARITPNQPDINPADNDDYLATKTRNSFDPNDKQCDQQFIEYADVPKQIPVVYTIRFQNTGTSEASFIHVIDSLDYAHLDVSTFKVISSSHPVKTSLSGHGIVDFFFDNINLPAAAQDEPASHGFVKYSIQPRKTLQLGKTVTNTADIFFDYNAPIRTNTVKLLVGELLATGQPLQIQSRLAIMPNPSPGIVRVNTGLDQAGTLFVFDQTGRLVLQQVTSTANVVLDLSNQPAGTYSIEWRGKGDGRKVGKVVIER